MLLTVNNQRTSSIAFQTDGLAFLSFTVPGSGVVTDKPITATQFAALEPQLIAAKTAGHITWSIKDDTSIQSDGTGTGGAGTVANQMSGAGAIDITTVTTRLTTTGATQALTLADGAYIGQRKTVMHEVDGGSAVITPAHPLGFATATLTAVRDWVTFEWNGAGWLLAGWGGTATFT
jgi:hypothetical protein